MTTALRIRTSVNDTANTQETLILHNPCMHTTSVQIVFRSPDGGVVNRTGIAELLDRVPVKMRQRRIALSLLLLVLGENRLAYEEPQRQNTVYIASTSHTYLEALRGRRPSRQYTLQHPKQRKVRLQRRNVPE